MRVLGRFLLTELQAEIVARMGRREDGEIWRFAGGYWAPSGTPIFEGGALDYVPMWWTTIEKLQALSRKGLVVWCDRHTWKLSALGREVAQELARERERREARRRYGWSVDGVDPSPEVAAGPCAGGPPGKELLR